MVVTAAAGGPNDVIARILASRMSEALGQQMIVENVTGAGGMIGIARVAKAPPDGYYLIFGGTGIFAQNQSLYKNPPYNAAADFTPGSLICEAPQLLITRKDLPVSGLSDFTRYAKENQARMQFGSGGAGTGGHIGCVLLNSAMAINVTHIPYRGLGPAMQDLQGSRIDYMCDLIATALPQIEATTVKAIATLSRQRSPTLPDLPTAEEQGLIGFDASVWFAYLLPRGTPAAIVQRLNAAMSRTLDTAAVRDRLRNLGISVVPPERRGAD
jgi:tripartite-type tricarboxylate transporter receptor subunit TctC